MKTHFNLSILLTIWFCLGHPHDVRAQEKTNAPKSLPSFIKVPSVTFTMGATPKPGVMKRGRTEVYSGPDWDEGPEHEVQLSTFQIANRQTTMAEFKEFMPEYDQRLAAHNIEWNPESAAVFLSWDEAKRYCDWLSNKHKRTFRLPTEAEWEFAAKNSKALKLTGFRDGVQEWCHDWWAPYETAPAANSKSIKDPQGPKSGAVRVVRDGGGGSIEELKQLLESGNLANGPIDYRFTDRSGTVVDDWRSDLGFRIVRGKLPQTKPPELKSDRTSSDKGDVVRGPFQGVKQEAYQWKIPEGGVPLFETSIRFINEPENEHQLPYWQRHHVPSLTWCQNGDLLATAFTAAYDNSDQMAILLTRLRQGNRTWDPPVRFFVAPDRNVTSAALFNASEGGPVMGPAARRRGEIHHYNGLGNHLCEDFSMLKRTSTDNGATWSPPKIVHRFPNNPASEKNPTGSPRLWPHMDIKRVRQNLNGRGVLMMSTDVGEGNSLGSAIFISEDEGDSWKELTRAGAEPQNFAKPGFRAGWIAGIHAPVVQLNDVCPPGTGSLLAFGRSNNIDGRAPFSHSGDMGKTWTFSASPFPPILSGQRAVMMRLREGPLLLISFTDTTDAVRDKTATGRKFVDSTGTEHTGLGMFAALSFDEGVTWKNEKLIPNWDKRPWRSRRGGYLTCVQTPDHCIHLLSSSHYYRFNLAWLKKPMAAPERQPSSK